MAKKPTPRSIVLHRAAVDNLGLFCDAGSTLTIGDAAEANTISADSAQDLLDSFGAIDPAAQADDIVPTVQDA